MMESLGKTNSSKHHFNNCAECSDYFHCVAVEKLNSKSKTHLKEIEIVEKR
ncbi:MAG: hypothetical protein PHW02_01840 [bacterium]|nr:hypothetical protein [bacterium]